MKWAANALRRAVWSLILTAGFFPASLLSQAPSHFRHFTMRDGLTDDRIYCIVRDKQGLLWVGTANGLNCFDGYSFRHFLPAATPVAHTLTGETVYSLLSDAQGRLWVGTGNGLSRWDPATRQFTHWNSSATGNGSLPNPVVLSMIFDARDQLWLSCDNQGLVKYEAEKNQFRVLPLRQFALQTLPGLSPDFHLEVTGLFRKTGRELWLESNVGYFSFDTERESFSFHPVPVTLPVVEPEFKTCGLRNYLRSWENDLLCYDGCAEKWKKVPLPLSADLTGGRRLVSSITHWKNGDVITAREGLFWMEGPQPVIRSIHAPPEGRQVIPTGPLNCAYADESGALWVGGENGLWLAEPVSQHVSYHQLKQPQSKDFYNTFTSFLEPDTGYFLALDFYFHRLHVFHQGVRIKEIELPPKAGLLWRDSQNQIWTGGGCELFHLQWPSLELKKVKIEGIGWEGKTKGYFTTMTQDAAGNYWFGHSEEGLICREMKSGRWWIPGKGASFLSRYVSSLLADEVRRCLWIATPDYGLYRYDFDTETFQLFAHDPARPGGSIPAWMATDLCLDAQGRLFLSTDPGGMACYEGGDAANAGFRVWGTAEGLPSGRVMSLVKDNAGRIWAGTLSGVACWLPSENIMRRFGAREGLVQEFMDLPLWINKKGEIVNGTLYGLQKWNPDSLLEPVAEPDIYLSAFRIFDRDIIDSLHRTGLNEIYLSNKENFFSFSLRSSDITHAERRSFRWKLHGFDASWNEGRGGRQRDGSYTNVPPGNYELEVMCALDGKWDSSRLRVKIIIVPSFWQTLWFRILAGLLLVAFVFYLFSRRIVQVRREEKLRAGFTQRIAQTELAALRAQMNPHFVFNCLNSINRYILVNQPEEASAYLSKFSRLIRLILDNSRTETVLLSRELEALQLYVEMERMRFDEKFDFRLEISPEVSPGSIEIPPLLIQPYVENAIWHGLMHKRGHGLLTVSIHKEGARLIIEITDNGVGRRKAQEYKSKSASHQKSHGMQLTAERISMINKLFGTQATVETTDLTDETGEAAGTRVTLSL